MNDQIGAFGHGLQLIVGDDGGDLDDGVCVRIETGHLEVHPREHGVRVPVLVASPVEYPRQVLDVQIRRLDPDLPLPAYAQQGDAGLDLLAREDVVLEPGGGRALVPTGLAIALPEGYAGFVQPRSGLALKHGVTCLNTPGLIDSGYRGELRVILVNTDPAEAYTVTRGERIAQLVVQAVERVNLVEVDVLDESSRGADGFGSTGR